MGKSLTILLSLIVLTLLFLTLPYAGIDFELIRQFTWSNPYGNGGFFNPPFLFIVAPHLNFEIGSAINRALIIVIFAEYLRINQAHKLSYLFLFTSAPMLSLLALNNIDWVIPFGLLLPVELKWLYLSLKPQMAISLAIYHFHKYRVRIAYAIVPVVLISFAIWPTWIIDLLDVSRLPDFRVNISFFPYSIPLGLMGLWLSFKTKDERWAIATGLCFSPYFSIPSLTIPQLVLSSINIRYGLLFYILIWIIRFS